MYDNVTVRECAPNAYRGDHQEHSYYKEVSEDDLVLDLMAETDGAVFDKNYFTRMKRSVIIV